jgi:hypothetical protein
VSVWRKQVIDAHAEEKAMSGKLARRPKRAPLSAKLVEPSNGGAADFLAGASETSLEGVRLRRMNDANNAWKAALEQLNVMVEALSDAKAAELIQQCRSKRGRRR